MAASVCYVLHLCMHVYFCDFCVCIGKEVTEVLAHAGSTQWGSLDQTLPLPGVCNQVSK